MVRLLLYIVALLSGWEEICASRAAVDWLVTKKKIEMLLTDMGSFLKPIPNHSIHPNQ